jgi:NAD(P)-dependent dehydrogenase (short-subunit alcohol dehydrogenase family)
MMAKRLAAEGAPYGVRVNAIAPGYMRTALTDQVLAGQPGLRQTWEGLIPLGRMGMPPELSGTVVYLASDASSYVTGSTLVIDGGYTAGLDSRDRWGLYRVVAGPLPT